jgi:hypothetical protein
VAITFKNKIGKIGHGSGLLISRNLVLTVAHNIYNHAVKEEAYLYDKQKYKIYLTSSTGIAQNAFAVEDWRFPTEFTNCSQLNKSKHDFALIKIKGKVDGKWFPKISFLCKDCTKAPFENIRLSIFGFPAIYEKNYSPADMTGSSMHLYQYGLAKSDAIQTI